MAARRLLIVMLILLGISTLAAALAPTRKSDTETATTTATPPPAPPVAGEPNAAAGTRLVAKIDADSGELTLIGTGEVPLRAGDELVLTVSSKQPDQIEVPGLGEVQAVSPDAPASFDLLLEDPGTYDVRLVDANRLVGRLRVSAAPPARGRASKSGPRGSR